VFPQNIASTQRLELCNTFFLIEQLNYPVPQKKKQTNKQTHPELFMEPRAEIGKSFPDMRDQQASKY
jgi:hypothetical protein